MTSSNTAKSLARRHAGIQDNIRQVGASLNAAKISVQLFNPDYKTHKIT